MFSQLFKRQNQTKERQPATFEQLLYQSVLQQEPMIVFSPQGDIVDANALFLQAIGYELSEIRGQHHRRFCDKEYASSTDYRLFWQ